jgi:hypothetical protein
MRYKDFKRDFWMLQKKLESGENFAFSRFSDGEMDIMLNKKVTLDSKGTRRDGKVVGVTYSEVDHKEFDPEKHSHVRNWVLEAYRFHKPNYFVGLSCPCCVGTTNNQWMKNERGGDDDCLTWANLFVNSNYPLFLENVVPILSNKKVVMICNEKANLNKLPFEVEKDFRIGSNAMVNNLDLSEEIIDWIEDENIRDYVFLFSASTLSNIAIYELFRTHPENTYIDVGTTLNPMMDMPIQRNYLRAYWLKSGNTEINKYCMW